MYIGLNIGGKYKKGDEKDIINQMMIKKFFLQLGSGGAHL